MSAKNRFNQFKHALLATSAASALALLSGAAAADVSVGFSYFDIDRCGGYDSGSSFSYSSFGGYGNSFSYSYSSGYPTTGISYSYFNSCAPRSFYSYSTYRPVYTYPLFATYGYVTPVVPICAPVYVDPYCAPVYASDCYPTYYPTYYRTSIFYPSYRGCDTYTTFAEPSSYYYGSSFSFGLSFTFGNHRRFRYAPSYYDCYDRFAPIYCPPVSRGRRHFAQVGPVESNNFVAERSGFAPIGNGLVSHQRPSVEAAGQMGPALVPSASAERQRPIASTNELPRRSFGPAAVAVDGKSLTPISSTTPTTKGIRPAPPSVMGPMPAPKALPGNSLAMPAPVKPAKTAPGMFKPVGKVVDEIKAAPASAPAPAARPVLSIPQTAKPAAPAFKPTAPVLENETPAQIAPSKPMAISPSKQDLPRREFKPAPSVAPTSAPTKAQTPFVVAPSRQPNASAPASPPSTPAFKAPAVQSKRSEARPVQQSPSPGSFKQVAPSRSAPSPSRPAMGPSPAPRSAAQNAPKAAPAMKAPAPSRGTPMMPSKGNERKQR